MIRILGHTRNLCFPTLDHVFGLLTLLTLSPAFTWILFTFNSDISTSHLPTVLHVNPLSSDSLDHRSLITVDRWNHRQCKGFICKLSRPSIDESIESSIRI